ncbi:MAG: helix-turn-helix transcriptional regulator [Firmicutes bacterium]|nr:helix-turn-helix transcriptional regulator [Bacillota bacterium]
MAQKKLADLLKEARTNAKLSQTALAEKVDGMTAAQIGKAERGELVPTQAQLKQIAKATGVTQTSLIEASKSASASSGKTTTSTAKKTSTSSTAAKKTSTSTSSKKTTSSSTSKKTTSSSTTLTASEKTMLEAYRKAKSDNKKLALKILKGEKLELSDALGVLVAGGFGGNLGNLGNISSLLKK